MGMVITKDLLKKIYCDYDKNKDKVPKKKPKIQKAKTIDIFKNKLIYCKNKDNIYKSEIKEEKNSDVELKIDKDNEVVNDEINKILLRRNKSHDFNLDNNIQNQFRISVELILQFI